MTKLITGVSQPLCIDPDTSIECRSLVLDTTEVGNYVVSFDITAKGDGMIQTSLIALKVCGITIEEGLITNF